MSNDISISLRGVSKRYMLYSRPQDRLKQALFQRFGRNYGQEFWALKDVSLDVYRGQTVGIIGQNGSGKSTLLQIISGLLPATEGVVDIHGRMATLLELGVGFNPEFTGRENIFLNSAILGISGEEIRSRLDEIIAFADIGTFIDQPVKVYSSGMYVRLAFAISANLNPEILIIDEVLAVGDAQFQQRCYRKLERLQEADVTILYVSHDVWTVKSICDHCVLLDKGLVVDQGNPKEIVDLYNAITAEKIAAEIKGRAAVPAAVMAEQRVDGEVQEYGSGEARITGLALYDALGGGLAAVRSGEDTIVRITGEFVKTMDQLVFGISIRDHRGREVYMTNTLWKHMEMPTILAGQSCTVDFQQAMDLVPGTYFIAGVISQKTPAGIVRLHWTSDLLQFDVFSEEIMGGVANLGSKVSVRETGAA